MNTNQAPSGVNSESPSSVPTGSSMLRVPGTVGGSAAAEVPLANADASSPTAPRTAASFFPMRRGYGNPRRPDPRR